MIRATTRYYIDKAIEDELRYALREKPLFHSNHEAYAVFLEEVEELEQEVFALTMSKSDLWRDIRNDDDVTKEKEELLKTIKNLIGEAVQTAAMLEKFSVREGEKNE